MKKSFKKLLALGLSIAMVATALLGCSSSEPAGDDAANTDAPATSGDSLEGTHVFMFKSTGNTFGDLMYEGFEEYLTAKGEKTAYKSHQQKAN